MGRISHLTRDISVVLITYNAQETLELCLESVKDIASEIILVDDYSTDKTLEIAARYSVKSFTRKLESFGIQKQFAINHAANDWIFLIDSDETATTELLKLVRDIVGKNGPETAWRLPRKNLYFGRWLRHGGKYPDYQVRLFRKSACRFSDDIVHERVIVSGETGTIPSPLIHYSYPSIDTWHRKLQMFSECRAEDLVKQGLVPGFYQALRFCVLRPKWRFLRRYMLKLGFMDGFPGFLACLHDALTEILGYFMFTQKFRSRQKPPLP